MSEMVQVKGDAVLMKQRIARVDAGSQGELVGTSRAFAPESLPGSS